MQTSLPVADMIASIFDQRVMGGRTWTIEKLADWIDEQDPTPREERPLAIMESERKGDLEHESCGGVAVR